MRAVILSMIIWLCAAAVASADWVEARSDNFIFVGDTSEKKAAVIVSELEDYRAMIFKTFNATPMTEMIPVRIYAGRSTREIKNMTGWEKTAGVYRTTREGPVFVMNIKGGFSKKSQARAIAYHEYTHHIVSTYTNTIYPLWYNEGFAEYLSTYEFDKKTAVASVGRPNDGRAMWLSRSELIPMDVLLRSVRRYPFKNDSNKGVQNLRSMFYAQSWLAVHHLRSNPEYNDKLRAYFERMNEYDVPDDAFEQAFGMTPDDYEDVLRAYFKKNRYAYAKVALGEDYVPTEVSTRVLSNAEAAFHQGEAVRLFRSGDAGAELAAEYYAEALSKDGANPKLAAQVEASKALMLSLDKKGTEAITALAPVLAGLSDESGVDDSRILTIAGLSHFNRYSADDRDADDMKTAREYLLRAMVASPSNITAHYYYAASYPATTDPISKQAVYSASEAALYYRGLQFTESNMPLADILMRENHGDRAVELLERARVWSQNGGVRRYATASLRRLGKLE